ncbi:MAG: hypothetical protein J6C12_07085 [Lachnospiraceae bacterium]|nr:hypothetical protein [Roseburia sp.]MBO5113094.1 hypothetical protein [Lachnospiraceae bacterium]
MIKKLFGETEEEQFKYLQPRLFALGVGVIALLIGVLLMQIGVPFGDAIGSVGTGICVIVLLVFGWTIMRNLFGFASLGALFSGNVVIGVVIFVLFIMIGYLGGFFVSIVGLCRFFVLLKKRKGNK